MALGRVLAAEFGDTATDRRLALYSEEHFEPKFFGADGGEFGWWFRLGEPWPRGQLSALMMMAEVGGPGAWARLYRSPNLAKFSEPTVEGVEFPALGISRAWNDPATGVLQVETYAADRSRAGAATRFRVTGLADAASVTVRCDGQEHRRWRVTAPNAIEIESEVADRAFEIVTGRPAGAVVTERAAWRTEPGGLASRGARVVRPRSIGRRVLR